MPHSPRASRARLQGPRVPQLPPLRPVVVACVLAWSAGGALACDAGDTASLAACVANVGTDSTINLTGNIALTGNIGVLAGNATVNGNGFTIDGADTHRGFFVGAGTVNINNVTLANLRAAGGAGGTDAGGGGGGGMGAGGAVFVRSGAAVTLDSVHLLDNAAAGGAGGSSASGAVQSAGGGGMGGAGGGDGGGGGANGGHGGGGLFEAGGLVTPGGGGTGGGPNGGAGGAGGPGAPGGDYSGGGGATVPGANPGGSGGFAGGGGGASNGCSTSISGGAGGFGGGGGTGACSNGGAGGFGGGGGSGAFGGAGGAGGFGAGNGTSDAGGGSGGGGGAGMGGAVFVQEGGALTVSGTTSLGGNSVAGGAGGGGAGSGSAFGSGIFLQGAGGALNFGNGNQVVSDVIADQAGSGSAGASSVAKTGSGTLRLEAANTYTGGTTLSAGTVEIADTGALGTGTVTLAGGALRVDTSGTVANRLDFAANQDSTVSAAAGETVLLTGRMAADTAAGAPTVMRFGSASDTGTIVVQASTATINPTGAGAELPTMVVAGGTLRAANHVLNFFTSNAASVTVDAGATLDFDGQPAGISLLLGSGTVLNTGATVVRAGDFAGGIAGSGSLVKDGTDTLVLTGNNTYTSGTTITQGTLQVGNGGASGSLGGGGVTNNAALVFKRSDAVAFSQAISGSGSVTQAGSGTLRLEAANTYTGGTTLSAGTVEIADTGALGTGAVTLAGGALRVDTSGTVANRLDFAANQDSTVSAAAGETVLLTGRMAADTAAGAPTVMRFGSASDTGTIVVQASTATINPTGAGAELPTMVVAGGTLRAANHVLNFFTSNAASVTVDAGATLDFDGQPAGISLLLGSGTVLNTGATVVRAGDFAGGIAGSGSLAKDGTDTLVLTGSNTYTSGTTITQGTLQVGNGGASGSLGGGGVTNNAALVFNRGDTFTVGQAISGTGSVTQAGSGTTILTGDNAYGGGTTISAGRLQAGNGGTTGSLGSGNITNNAALAFNRSDSFAVGNAISGSGSVTQAGSGTLRLEGSNTYSGGTTVAAGTLEFGDADALGSGTVTLAGGTLRATGSGTVANDLEFAANQSSTISAASGQTLELTGSVGVANEAGAPTVMRFGSVGDTGTILFNASGTTIATGPGAARQQIVVGGGTLRDMNGQLGIQTGYAAGVTVAAGATLDMNGNANGIASLSGAGRVLNSAATSVGAGNFAGTIEGSGSLTKDTTGTLVLTGNSTYGGGTAIQQGTLQVGNGGTSGSLGTGNVTNNGNLVFSRSDAFTVGNAISGTGTLEKAGTGTMILMGNNSYQGTTTISGGTLQVGAGGAAGSLGAGNVTNNGTLVFNRSDDVALGHIVTGTGTLAQSGAGRLTLTSNNAYGATVISAGTLQVGDGGTTGSLGSGNVTNNGALAFNRSDTVSLANVISGTGSLTQAGSGNLVLTGASTYTGGTFVNAGTLSVNGSIVGNTTVNNGGTLGGTGSVGSVNVAGGGTLAPGNSIGALTVNGNLSFAPGSTYRVEANAAGAADRVNAVGAGTITINGGTVDVQASGAGYQRNTAYTILSSGGATTGQFDTVTSNLAFLTPTLIYSANGVALNLQASDALNYASVARTPNQTAVANYLQGIANTPGDAAALIQQFDNMTAEQASASFESMAGSAHASASHVASALGRNFSATLASRSGFSTSGLGNAMNDWSQVRYASLAPVETSLASSQERGLWAQALGAGGRVDSDGNAAGSRYRNSGLVLGYDQPVTGQWLAGGAVGYNTSWWNATSGDPSSGKIESPQAGLYARYTTDTLRVRIDGTFSSHDFTTDRTVNIAGVGATANSKHKGRELGLGAQVEMPIKAGDWELRPLAGLRYAHLNEDGFNETGQSPANLAVAERTTQNTLLSAGMHFVRPFNQGKAGLELRAVASHLAGDNDSPVTASLIGQPGSFTATGVPLKRNALTLGTTVSGQFTRNVAAYLDANYEVRGSGQDAYQLTGGVRVTF